MSPRQNASLDRYRTNLVERAPVRTNPVLRNLLAERAFAQKLVIVSEFLLAVGIVSSHFSRRCVLDLLDQRVALDLSMGLGIQRIFQTLAHFVLQRVVVRLIHLRSVERAFRISRHRDQLLDTRNDLFDLTVRELDGGQNDFFRLLFGARLDHHNAVLVADNHDVHRRACALLIRRVDDELAIHPAHADCANCCAKWNV
jgi:hypothetical protein